VAQSLNFMTIVSVECFFVPVGAFATDFSTVNGFCSYLSSCFFLLS
jgi:hypothetical protein